MDIAPEVYGHLDRLKDGLHASVELRGLYLYGSLTTGDFSPASSDIDVLAVTGSAPDGAALGRLSAVHLDLARRGGAYARLNCLYVPDGTLADQELVHAYWYGTQFSQWQLKVMTVAELDHSGRAVQGPWPPPGLPEVSTSDLREHARDQLAGYWRRLTYRPGVWLQDRSQAILKLGDFGVPGSLADQIRRRRAGEAVPVTATQRVVRAARARQIMAAGIRTLAAR